MSLDPGIKKNWIEAQKRSAQPVNAIGIPIDPKDKQTLGIWKREGIDQYLASDEASTNEG